MFREWFVVALSGLLVSLPSQAERLTPERVFAAPDLNGSSTRNVQLSPDGRRVGYLKPRPDDATVLDLWVVDVQGGEPFRLVHARALSPDDQGLSDVETARRERLRIRERGVVEYRWSADGNTVLVPLNGDLWLATLGERAEGKAESTQLRRLTRTTADEIDAKVSPRGRFVSYVRDQNLYVLDLHSGRERALSNDGAAAVSWGLAEFVAQEEMRRDTGYWWSPDERRLAVTRVDESAVEVVLRTSFGSDRLGLVEQRYPRAGGRNAQVELYVVNVDDGRKLKVDLGKEADVYLARVDWSQDGKTLYIQRQSRDQTRLDLLACDVASGATRVLLTETSSRWVELTDDFRPLRDGAFLWSSERSGWRHLYLYSAEGKLIRQLTRGEWPVDRVEGVDERRKRVFFGASKDSALERHLYVASYERVDQPRKLTAGEGWWSFSVAKDARTFTGVYSDPRTPPRTAVYRADGVLLRWIEANTLDASHPYAKFSDRQTVPEYGSLQATDGAELHYALWKPPGFDPKRKYPAVVAVYGGPMRQHVKKHWGALTDQLLLEEGYVLFRLDNRGSANRSVAFKTAIHRRLGEAELEDQLLGARFLAGLPYVDPQRLGVMGWSYGGFMTLMLMTAESSPFKAGIAGAAPVDWRLYDTHYTERYMGTPAANEAGYCAAEIVPRLSHLRGDLLIMHGMADDNVTFDNATRIVSALQAASQPFEMMVYPGEAHLLRKNSAELHRWRVTLDFLRRKLRPDAWE